MQAVRFGVSVFLTALLVLLQPNKAEARDQTITRQNQAEQECGLTVDAENVQDAELGVDWVRFRITIPKDDRRLERLVSIRFILGTKGATWPWRVSVPIRPSETDKGEKTFDVLIHRSEVHDAFVEFDCMWADPRISTIDTAHLVLDTYLLDTSGTGR